MKKILIVNQKGGSGKSTLADLILWEYEKAGIPAAFYDLDRQGGVMHEENDDPDAPVAVIDTPGALQSDLGKWITEADLIIVPTKTTMLDVKPLQRMIAIVSKAACPVIYVESMWDRFTTSSSFTEWLIQETGGTVPILRIPRSEMVVQASAVGMSVIDYAPKSPVASACKEVVAYIRAAVGV